MRRGIFSIVSVSPRWPCTWAQPVMRGLTLWRRDNGEIRSANASLRAIGCGRGPTIDISPSCNIHQLWELVDLLCAETAAAIDEMTNILRRNLRDLHACAGRGETPPLEERLRSVDGRPPALHAAPQTVTTGFRPAVAGDYYAASSLHRIPLVFNLFR